MLREKDPLHRFFFRNSLPKQATVGKNNVEMYFWFGRFERDAFRNPFSTLETQYEFIYISTYPFCVTLILFVISKIYTVHFGSLIFDKRLMSAYVCVSFCSMTCEHDVHGEINHVETLITMIIVKTYIDIFFQL